MSCGISWTQTQQQLRGWHRKVRRETEIAVVCVCRCGCLRIPWANALLHTLVLSHAHFIDDKPACTRRNTRLDL